MTIRLLQSVADEPEGTVLVVNERRAQRLILQGYAELVRESEPERPKRKVKE